MLGIVCICTLTAFSDVIGPENYEPDGLVGAVGELDSFIL